jgi:hypothetical protein
MEVWKNNYQTSWIFIISWETNEIVQPRLPCPSYGRGIHLTSCYSKLLAHKYFLGCVLISKLKFSTSGSGFISPFMFRSLFTKIQIQCVQPTKSEISLYQSIDESPPTYIAGRTAAPRSHTDVGSNSVVDSTSSVWGQHLVDTSYPIYL